MMDATTFLDHFGTVAEAPGGLDQLRSIIRDLAARGRLVKEAPNEGSGTQLLCEIRAVRQRMGLQTSGQPDVSNSRTSNRQPFTLPAHWTWAHLGELGVTRTGATPKKAALSEPGPRLPFIRPSHISAGRVDTNAESVPLSAVPPTKRTNKVPSILCVCIGTIGKVGLCEESVTFNQQINSIEVFGASVNFVYLMMNTPVFQALATAATSATTIRILNKGKWERLPIPLPPLAEQVRIVERAEALLAMCDTLEQAMSRRDDTARRLANAARSVGEREWT